MNCPRCHGLLEQENYCTDCGWVRPRQAQAPPPGPDHARIAAERERSIARADEPVRKFKLACQSTLCPPNTRALPGRDLCAACARLEDSGALVKRVNHRPNWIKRAGDLLKQEVAA